jgi:hypothetical protein
MAAKTQYVDFSGTIAWANSSYGGLFSVDPKFDNYKANFYLDPKSWEAYKKTGLRLKTYNDDLGDYVQFKRRATQMIGNKLENFGPPKVFFAEGIEPTKDIGNGSGFTCTVEIFDTRNGKGHRLNRVVITDLVKYESTSGNQFDDSKLRTLDDVTSSPSKASSEPNVMDKEELEDSDFSDQVPFGQIEPKTTAIKKASPFRR